MGTARAWHTLEYRTTVRGQVVLCVYIVALTASFGSAGRSLAAAPSDRGGISVESRSSAVSIDAAPRGGPEPSTIIRGDSACPRPDAVWAEVTTLVPHEHLDERVRDLLAAAPPIEIMDLGPRYRLIAAGRVREYRDDARDCAHRAHVAAVFVALVLDPAAFLPPPPVVTAMPAAAASPPARTYAAHLELGAAIGTGASVDRPALLGAALHVAFGRGTLALVVGATAAAPTETTVNGLRVRALRAPADVGLRARLAAGWVEISGDLGLTWALLSERALDLATSNSRTATEIGARAAVALRFSGTARVAPFVTAYAEVVPWPTELFALPRGVVGHTPTVWIGAVAGASLGL